jgi:hypothetical protein
MELNIEKETKGYQSLNSNLPENIRDSTVKPVSPTP